MNRKILFYCLSALLLLTACGKGHNDESSTASNKVISSGSDLDGHSVGFITGSEQDFYVSEHASGATPVSMASTSEVLAATAKGLCDYSLSDETTIMCVDLKESHLKVVGNINNISFPLAAGFRKDDPSMKEVKQSLDDFILQQKENHVLDSMAKRWATPRLDTVLMPKVQLPTSGKTLVIGSMNDNAPFGFIRNGEFVGFEAELIYRWAAETGHRVRIEYYPFSSLIAALQTNKIDIIISSVSVTEERQQHIDFSEPYYFCHTIVLQGDQAATSGKGFWQWVKTGVQDNLIAEGRWKMISIDTPTQLKVEYSEKDYNLYIEIAQQNRPQSLLDDPNLDTLALNIVKGYCDELTEAQSPDGTRTLHLKVKKQLYCEL